MALTMGQLSGLGTIPHFVAQVPPGPGQLVLSPVSGTVYIGAGSAVSVTSGVLVPSGGLSIPLYSGGGPTQLYALGGTPSALSWVISTSYGLAQPGLQ